jgi:hypothetical protein
VYATARERVGVDEKWEGSVHQCKTSALSEHRTFLHKGSENIVIVCTTIHSDRFLPTPFPRIAFGSQSASRNFGGSRRGLALIFLIRTKLVTR